MPYTIWVLPIPLAILLMTPLLLAHYFLITMTISSSSGTLHLFPVWRWIPLLHLTHAALSSEKCSQTMLFQAGLVETSPIVLFDQTLFISLSIFITICNFIYFACFLIVYLPFKMWALWKWIPPSCSPFHDHFLAQCLAHNRWSINICWINGWVSALSRNGS